MTAEEAPTTARPLRSGVCRECSSWTAEYDENANWGECFVLCYRTHKDSPCVCAIGIEKEATTPTDALAEAESYTDTLNDLFPWGCETESEVITELVRRLDALKDETAGWIDALQGTDAARHARLDALGNREAAAIRAHFRILEKRVATVMSLVVEGDLVLGARLDALETFADDTAALLKRRAARHNAQAQRMEALGKWVDGTDLITSERFCALTERVGPQAKEAIGKVTEILDSHRESLDMGQQLFESQGHSLDALTGRIDNLECGLRLQMERQSVLAGRLAKLERPPNRPAWERDFEQREWLHGGGAVEYDAPPKDASDIAPDKSAACTCGAGDAIPQDHDEDCPKYDAAHIPF